MTTADTQDVVTPTDSSNGEAGRLCVQRLVSRQWQNVTLINADCRDVPMPEGVDCVMTDPPYPDQYEKEYDYRADGLNFLKDEKCLQLIFWSPRYDFPLDYTAKHIWDKQMGCKRAEYEMLYERNGQTGHLMFRCNLINNKISAQFQRDEFTGHPSQKPRNLLTRIMTRLCKDSKTIYDPFMGSGSTAIACIRTGRAFVGVEQNPKHYQTAVERVERELSQGVLLPANEKADRL
jgi:site-specific DNA-methyltransferase (adenine-specific)